MKALVTGGGGFLGGRIAEMLRNRDDDVTVLGRRPYPHLHGKGIATIQADVRDAQAVSDACTGMDVIFHVAAITNLWGRRRPIWEINVDGTRQVISGCRRHGVPRLVYTSTPSVVFGKKALCGVDESQPYPTRHLANYPASKAAAERAVLKANGDGLLTIALRPHLIWGPGDPHLIPRILDRAHKGALIRVGDGENRVDITYIDNAARAHLLACDRLISGAACAGKPYFISQGEPVKLWPWLDSLLERVGAPAIKKSMPYAGAYAIGALSEWAAAILCPTRELPMTRFLASQLGQSHYFDISAARRDLGYDPQISTAEGVELLVASLADEGFQN